MIYLKKFKKYHNIYEKQVEYSLYNDRSVYWEINVKQPHIKVLLSLKKIGFTDIDAEEWCEFLRTRDNIENDSIFVCKNIDRNEWFWTQLTQISELKERGLKFMGVVDVEDWEVDAEKYNL